MWNFKFSIIQEDGTTVVVTIWFYLYFQLFCFVVKCGINLDDQNPTLSNLRTLLKARERCQLFLSQMKPSSIGRISHHHSLTSRQQQASVPSRRNLLQAVELCRCPTSALWASRYPFKMWMFSRHYRWSSAYQRWVVPELDLDFNVPPCWQD
jgi:hypothetical protein